MTIDFQTFNDSLLTFFETGLPIALTALETEKGITLPRPEAYLEDIPDMQRGEAVVFWMICNQYSFDDLSNESRMMTATPDCFVTIRGVKNKSADDLKEIAKHYMTAIYSLVDQNPDMDGVADFSVVTDMTRYDAAEGFETAKAIAFGLEIRLEV